MKNSKFTNSSDNKKGLINFKYFSFGLYVSIIV